MLLFERRTQNGKLVFLNEITPEMAIILDEFIANNEDIGIEGGYDPQIGLCTLEVAPATRISFEDVLGLQDYFKVVLDYNEVTSVAYGHLSHLSIILDDQASSCVTMRVYSVKQKNEEELFELLIKHPLPESLLGNMVHVLMSLYRDRTKGTEEKEENVFATFMNTLDAVQNDTHPVVEKEFLEHQSPVLKIFQKNLEGAPRVVKFGGLSRRQASLLNTEDYVSNLEDIKKSSEFFEILMNILENGDATVVGVSSLYDTPLLEGKSKQSDILELISYLAATAVLTALTKN